MNFICEIENILSSWSDGRKELNNQDNILQDLKCSPNTFAENSVDHNIQLIQLQEKYHLKIYGYRRNNAYVACSLALIALSFGIFGLFCYWSNRLYLYVTHSKCPLIHASRILIEKKYEDQSISYYVKKINIINYESVIKNSKNHGINNIDYETMSHLKTKFGGPFKKMEEARYFNCEKLRFFWDSELCQFYQLHGLDNQISTSYFHKQKGLTSLEQHLRQAIYGLNKIVIPQRGFITLIFIEMLNPIYVFQFFSFIIWLLHEYVLYASIIIIMTIISIIGSCLQTYFTRRCLRKQLHSSDFVCIIRDEKQISISSEQLVPGDILVLPRQGCNMQCDAVLLRGSCTVDEISRAGKRKSVLKMSIPDSLHLYENEKHGQHTLYCGTEILETNAVAEEIVLAIVIRTGFLTMKGATVRALLYQKPAIYNRNFINFLVILSGIGFSYTIISEYFKVDLMKILAKVLKLIIAAVPFALAVALITKPAYQFLRLKQENMHYTKKMRKFDEFSKMSEAKSSEVNYETAWLGTDLIVLGLSSRITDKELRVYFSKFGELQFAEVKVDPVSNLSKGYGFIRFVEQEVQIRVLLQKHRINDRWCEVRIPDSKNNMGERSSYKVFVGQCTKDLTEDVLREYFSRFGDITDLYVPEPFRGFAFVTFVETDSAKTVCAREHQINDTNVTVTEAIPKDEMEKYDRSRSRNCNRNERDYCFELNYNDRYSSAIDSRKYWNEEFAYRNSSRKWHEDRSPDVVAAVVKKAVREVNENWRTTSDLFDSYEEYCLRKNLKNRKRKKGGT